MSDPDKSDIELVLTKCLVDLKAACWILFPEIYTAPFSTLHDQIFELLNSGHKKIVIAAPRGIGKTSIARTLAMRAILFRLSNFIVYLSNSATSAEMQTENIKRDLLSNQQVKYIFGNIKESIDKVTSIDESFSKSAWSAYGNTYILPRGAGQQVRGLNWSNYRPDLIIIDDLENKDEIQSKENRDKLKSWFWSDLMKTESRYGRECSFIYIDTIKHEDSLLVDLLNSPQWKSLQLSICDDNYNSYDENYMTTAEIKEEVEEHRRLGTLDLFYMERRNIPIAKEDAVFKQSYFKYFEDLGDSLKVIGLNGEVEEIRTYNLTHITIVDPAKTVKLQNAETCVITMAVDRTSRKIFDREIVSRRMYPDEIYDEMFRQVKQFNSFILGYETTGLSEFISQPIESECRVRNIHPMLMELTARRGIGERGKIERIATLAPLYRLGYMYHNKNNCGVLEGQLLGFPRSKLWDVMDAKAYITYIMDKHAVYFDPSDEVEETPIEDDYASLSNDSELDEQLMGFAI